MAPLKIASGCDRRCSFCAIPAFRGAFLSRPPEDLVAEAEWLAGHGVRELVLVSENSTSYGKDLGNPRLLDELLPALAAVPGIDRIRVSYLQPAELRPALIEVMTSTPGVAPYFDLSFQHASGRVLRAMRRFGDRERFGALLDQVRQACPEAGVRSNFIVGFPGETAADVGELQRFLSEARLDAIGIFGYSDEDGTEAATLDGQLDPAEIARRVDDLAGPGRRADGPAGRGPGGRGGATCSWRRTSVAGPTWAGRPTRRRRWTGPRPCAAWPGRASVSWSRPGSPRATGWTWWPTGSPCPRRPPGAGDRIEPARRGDGRGGAAGPARAAGRRPPAGRAERGQRAHRAPAGAGPGVRACSCWPAAPAGGSAAFAVFLVASVTDLLDGRIARQRGLITDFGKIADPIADKALTGAALVTLSALG